MKTVGKHGLCPVQEQALQNLFKGITVAGVLLLKGRPGAGKSTILTALQCSAGGCLLGMREFVESLAGGAPTAIEEAVFAMLDRALSSHDLVFVDDFHLVTNITGNYNYTRQAVLDAVLTAILGAAAVGNKKLVFASDEDPPDPIERRVFEVELDDFGPTDYEFICSTWLDPNSQVLDYERIHTFAPSLSALELRNASQWHGLGAAVDTESFLSYLRSTYLKSNVEIKEVEPVDWTQLKGVDNILRELEAKIALPFEHHPKTTELGLKPKRGVLLVGPPGTGKTTIGRALAHRLKGKFFLIDGTVVADSRDFYSTIDNIFEAAKENAPSIVFIDDADVIFESGNKGFYRYLLTILDGLESARAARVCIMMTAMYAGSLPPAVVRSGRVELWLETRLPDLAAREEILRDRMRELPDPIGCADRHRLAQATHGLTGADLKNIVEDGKLMFAHDQVHGRTPREPEQYFLDAIQTIRKQRREYTRSKPPRLVETVKVGFSA
jgi:SpoVK/Ycf46/Vps4 family AAA+-type ATPase